MPLTHIDCFSGPGGICTGMHAAGFDTKVAIEFIQSCVETYSKNHPEVHVIHSDIRDVTADQILPYIPEDGVDIVTSGMPCETFSTAGNTSRSFYDDRQFLFREGIRIAEIAKAQYLSLNKEVNYEVATLNKMISKWDSITDSLCAAVKYYEKLGFESKKLSKNYIMSIAYYMNLHGLSEDHFDKQNDRANCDRVLIRQWTLRSMINGLFNYGTRNILARIRDYIKAAENQKYFPLDRLFNLTSSISLSISKEQILDDILTLKYGDIRIDPLLRELSRNDSGHRYSVDHIWAQDLIKNKKTIKKNYRGISEEDLKKYTSYGQLLPNLQLLTPNENSNKGNKYFKEWDESQHTSTAQKTNYYTMNFIPIGISFSYDNFIEFFEKRRDLLCEAIEAALPPTFEEIVTKYQIPVHS